MHFRLGVIGEEWGVEKVREILPLYAEFEAHCFCCGQSEASPSILATNDPQVDSWLLLSQRIVEAYHRIVRKFTKSKAIFSCR